ncbi:MAG: pirin family protein [Candidatus Micrarchaeota archaeon]|nr:pirin family protein [Candidatus Micrarchaeota archaeon]
MGIRKVSKIITGRYTIDGAGVKLFRLFSNSEAHLLDPFLLLDSFGSDNPSDYIAGFPWHPHRGIETVTYMINGKVEHGDSLGNKGVIKSGEIQWMTAGSGIIHQEMPKETPERSIGFQLWVNLPAKEKMCHPTYRGITADEIKETKIGDATAKVVCGKVNGVTGPVHGLFVEAEYLDITLPAGKKMAHKTNPSFNVFAFVYEGAALFGNEKTPVKQGQVALFSEGESVSVITKDSPAKFLLISGKPLREPIAWGGPIVMNTEGELAHAFEELQLGTFIKHKKK